MKKQEFKELVKEIQKDQLETFTVKESEYVKGDEQFYNFIRASIIANSGNTLPNLATKEGALYGMFLKHLVSFLDMLETPINNCATIQEKCRDMRNYVTLAEGMLLEAARHIPK